MQVTTTDFKLNLDKYLKLIGRVPANLDRHSVRAERLSKYTIAE